MRERNGARELGLVIGTLAVLIHFLDGPAFWVATALLVATVVAATLYLLGERRPWRVPLDRLVLPGLAAFAAAGLAHLVNPVPWLAVVFAGTWLVVALAAAVETAPATGLEEEGGAPASGPAIEAGHPRPLAARLTTLIVAFLALSAVGGFVVGGLSLDAKTPDFSVVAGAALFDLVIGALTGCLLTATRPHRRRDLVAAAVLYAVVLGVAGGLLRAAGIPRLLGPAVLTLLAYLIASFVDSPAPARRSRQLLGEAAVLCLAGCAVIALGLAIR
jgi:hypothetical protein